MKTGEFLQSKLDQKGVILHGTVKAFVCNAMQEYADQEAIEFAKWLECNYQTNVSIGQLYINYKKEIK